MAYTLKKSLGQHFLKDETISKRIVEELKKNPIDRLLEVGPGGGALTKYLLTLDHVDFKAVELDNEKIGHLLATYPTIAGKIISDSILDTPIPFDSPFAVVGNFPYNISTQIVFRILEWGDAVTQVIGMFQKEVAERIVAKEGSKVYGVTSVLVQAWYEAEYLFEVSETAFNPPPNVKSAVIRLKRRTDVPEMRSREKLFLLVKTAFNQRRKTLRNAVRGLFKPELLNDPLFDKRAEQLSVHDFARLTFQMN
jgi:16S rRNA (adenine1518-N6/adenine1519-N6)-dimethyltransferase